MNILKSSQEQVLGVLQSVAGIVERRNTLPILSNVLIRKTADEVQFTTSDLEIQIQTSAKFEGDAGQMATTVAARKLIDILRSIPSDQQVTLESRSEEHTSELQSH